MLGIVIITYNIPVEVTLLQIDCIRRFCKDEFEIEIIDNSIKQESIDNIRHHCERLGINYTKTFAHSNGGSESHSFAANFSYLRLKDTYDHFLYLDHDCIPIKDFSVKEILGERTIAGIGQYKIETYPWPGCLMFDNTKVDKSLVDFSCGPGLDTGGMLYKLFDKNITNSVMHLDEVIHQNPNFNGSIYQGYTLINKGMFFHFVNASNWTDSPNHEERINSLINLVKSKING